MGINNVNDELISTVRSVVGVDYSEMDIIRALHMAKNDPTAAINIIFDAPSFKKSEIPKTSKNLSKNSSSDAKILMPKSRIGSFSEGENGNLRTSDGGSLRVTEGGDCNLKVFEGQDGNLRGSEGGNGNLRVSEVKVGDLRGSEGDNLRDFVVKDGNLSLSEGNDSSFRVLVGGNCNLRASEGGNLSVFEGGDCNLMVSEGKDCNLRVSEVKYGNLSVSKRKDCNLRVSEGADGNLRGSSNLECVMNEVEMENVSEGRRDCGGESSSRGKEWWFVGSTDVLGMSTCKGRILKVGEQVNFYFPEKKNVLVSAKFGGGRGRQAANPDIVRFSTIACGEIGRIPNDWARCLLPLVRDKKVDIVGHCKSAPNVLGIMDTIVLTISVYINSSMFRKMHQISLKAASESVDESVVHPLPTLFRLLELAPFRKAEFTPGDLFTRKRPLSSADSSTLPSSILHLNKCQSSSTTNGDSENEESISDNDLDRIVGVTEDTQLEEMDPPSTLQCGLRPYQKQALHWMVQLERGQCTDDASTTLHPCWAAFHLADKRGLVIYLNAFSGDATIEFPSTLQMAKGGILADSMGLGKTIMTISLLLTHSERGRSVGSQSPGGTNEAVHGTDESSMTPKTLSKFSGFRKLARRKGSLTGGGNLIICPMTLIGQWKAEIETHAQPGSLSVYVHYGQNRSKDAHALAQYDVILTTYGVLASEYSTENAEDCGGLYSIRWFRVVLDEAHTIKSSKSQISAAAAALIADRRWCLTGTPIQNKLEDIFSLLRFLRVEPWRSWAWWNKLVQKPFEEGDERGLKLVQSILKPIMLRRTKSSSDREGRPILVLPPATTQVIYCELTEAEKDFYDALFKRSKVKFDQFVEQGRVLHNYASILELLLRLRQCCDHPYLVLSRGDTQEFSDLDKLAKRFLKGGRDVMEGQSNDAPSHAYIKEVVEELRKGEQGECPICLEAFEDSVLTPCAHRLCRECLLASWRSANSGLCPVCRKTVNRQELITAPTESRFHIDIEKNWVSSSKVSALLHELEILKCQCSKSIVFSQWTAFLDLLQIPLSRSNISFVRLDGTLNLQQREKVLQRFSKEDDIMVLLMSLKAGGVGINLTAASNAFIMDPWWNPAVEEQAVMRIHRIGQTKSVSIKRFIVKGTVENRMEAVQARKQRMISGALTDQEVRTARIDELKMLFT